MTGSVLQLRNSAEFSALKCCLREESAGREVYYVANPGNWGDALIRAGTLRLLREMRLNYQEVAWETPFPSGREKLLIFGGGGAWCRFWRHAYDYVKKASEQFDRIVVLPSTFDMPCDLANCVFFARDRFESATNLPQARFCHDMAFYLGGIRSGVGCGRGNFFRTDVESGGCVDAPGDNCDISAEGTLASPLSPFFKTIGAYREVLTDRLHVAIAGALMRKRVHLFEGGYFKNTAVYRSSMRQDGTITMQCPHASHGPFLNHE